MIVRPAPPEHFAWLVERTGFQPSPALTAIEAVDAGGRIVGMVGYDDWTLASCRMHMAGAAIAARALLRPAFEYPFVQLGLELVIGYTPGDCRRALRFARHVGFREAHVFRGGWSAGVDLHVFEMRRGECRWLERNRKVA